jgi:hypothetical protein
MTDKGEQEIMEQPEAARQTETAEQPKTTGQPETAGQPEAAEQQEQPPQGNYGMPPQGNYGMPPQGNYGMPPQGNYGMPSQGNYGMPLQGNYGMPPQGNYGAPPQMYAPGYNYPPPVMKPQTTFAERFAMMGIPTIVYAVICAICLYRNLSGIFSSFIGIITVCYMAFAFTRYEKYIAGKNEEEYKTGRAIIKQGKLWFYYVAIILLACSLCLTSDSWLIAFSNIGIYLMALGAAKAYFYDTNKWGFVKHFIETCDVIISPFAYIGKIFSDSKANRMNKGRKNKNVLLYILLGIAIVLIPLVIIVKLLTLADPVFEEVVIKVLGSFFSWDIIGFSAFVFCSLIYVYGLLVKLPRNDLNVDMSIKKKFNPIIAITASGALTFVYLVFAVIQILFLFINSMSLPDNMTYAEYARRGFYQLLLVVFLNIIIVILCAELFENNAVLKFILTLMSICTYIMMASSAMRMIMYIQVYNLTRARFFVLVALGVMAIVMAGIIIKLYADFFPLARYTATAIVAVYIVMAFIRPSYFIADYNLNHGNSREIDFYYIVHLGQDATPVLSDYIDEYGDEDIYIENRFGTEIELSEYFDKIQEKDEKYGAIRGFNFARNKAKNKAKMYKGGRNL